MFFSIRRDTYYFVQQLEGWFTQGGNSVIIKEVRDAASAALAMRRIKGRFVIERQTLSTGQGLDFCKAPVQNMPVIFTGGALDALATPEYRCPSISMEVRSPST